MSKQKKVEEDYDSDDDGEELKGSDANDGKKEGKDSEKKFQCRCGKSYDRQSSLFNHIKIKHGDDKEGYQVPRNVKPGRPKITDNQDKGQSRQKKKEKKPDGLDDGTWFHLLLYKNKLFQQLIISFKDCLKTKLVDNDKDEELIWKQYEKKRDDLLEKINLPKEDREELQEKTNFLLKKLGIIMEQDKRVNIFISFIRAYIKKFYSLSDKNLEILKRDIDETTQEMFDKCYEILEKEFKDQEFEEILQSKKENSQEDLGDQGDAKNDQEEVSQSELDEQFDKEQQEQQEQFDDYQLPQQQQQQGGNLQQISEQPYEQQNFGGDQNDDQFMAELERQAFTVSDPFTAPDPIYNQNGNPGQIMGGQRSLMNPASFKMQSYQNINYLNRQAFNMQNQSIQNYPYLMDQFQGYNFPQEGDGENIFINDPNNTNNEFIPQNYDNQYQYDQNNNNNRDMI